MYIDNLLEATWLTSFEGERQPWGINKIQVFAHLFQESMATGDIPKEWPLANICPVFKKRDRSLACNYRPVSVTCVPCKLLEHIVCSNIMAHLDEYKLLSVR